MNITEKFLSLGKKARGDRNTGKPIKFSFFPDRIIIHWIGPYPGQSVMSAWYWWEHGSDGSGVVASAHFIINGKDVLQALPLDEVGWHSGDNRNWRSIGIEVVPMNAAGEYSPETIETLKELVAHIRETYPKTTLERHYDGTQKKDCPRFYTPVTSLLDGGGRVANPEGGDERWIKLRNYLDGEVANG